MGRARCDANWQYRRLAPQEPRRQLRRDRPVALADEALDGAPAIRSCSASSSAAIEDFAARLKLHARVLPPNRVEGKDFTWAWPRSSPPITKPTSRAGACARPCRSAGDPRRAPGPARRGGRRLPIVVAVERVPPELIAAIDRLRGRGDRSGRRPQRRRGGRGGRIRRTGCCCRRRPDRRREPYDRLLDLGGLALLTMPDVRVDERYERIDADSRWAGLALLDGALLQRTAAMLRDWDLQSTLLRRAVQAGARQLAVPARTADEP